MVRWECFRLQDDLVSSLLVWLIERTHQKVQVSSKRLHQRHLLRLCAHNRCHHISRLLIHINPCRVWVVLQSLKVASYSLGCPCCEILANALWHAARLDAQGVATQVDRLIVRVDVWLIDA